MQVTALLNRSTVSTKPGEPLDSEKQAKLGCMGKFVKHSGRWQVAALNECSGRAWGTNIHMPHSTGQEGSQSHPVKVMHCHSRHCVGGIFNFRS